MIVIINAQTNQIGFGNIFQNKHSIAFLLEVASLFILLNALYNPLNHKATTFKNRVCIQYLRTLKFA